MEQQATLWYLKSEHETRLRFDDYLETAMIEAVPAETNSGAAAALVVQVLLLIQALVLMVSSIQFLKEETFGMEVILQHYQILIQSLAD